MAHKPYGIGRVLTDHEGQPIYLCTILNDPVAPAPTFIHKTHLQVCCETMSQAVVPKSLYVMTDLLSGLVLALCK